MNWKTWLMGGSALRGNKRAHQSHAVDMDRMEPICSKVKIHSLQNDSSTQTNELPDCPECRRILAKQNK